MSRSVSPMKSGILSSLSNIFKKKDQADQATPMMLGNPANFKYDPIKKKYIFLDEPEEQDEVLKPPPTKQQVQSKSLNKEESKKEEIKKEEINQMLVPPSNPTLRGRKKQSKDQIQGISQIIEYTSKEEEGSHELLIEKVKEIQLNPDPPIIKEIAPKIPQIQDQPQEEVKYLKENLHLVRINSSENQSKRTGQDSFQDYGQTPQLSINLAMPDLQKVQQPQRSSLIIPQSESTLVSQIKSFLTFSDGLSQSEISLNNKDQTTLYKAQQRLLDNLVQQKQKTEWEESLKIIQYQQNQLNYNNELIYSLMEEIQNSTSIQDNLEVEIEKKDFIINQQNELIKEMINKLNEFVNYSVQVFYQYVIFEIKQRNIQEILKEERHQQSLLRQNLQIRNNELEIELSNSRKETEIFQRQNEMISKDKNSYIKYYEDLRKEMQDNINELNSKLDESLNMSTSENQTYMIENQQLKQQLDVITSEKKLLENNLSTTHHIYSELKQEIFQVLQNEFNAISNILAISQIPIQIEPAIELRRSLFKYNYQQKDIIFSFQKELRQTLQQRENKVQQEIISFKGQIQSSLTKVNQQIQFIEKLQNQNLQYEQQINSLKLQIKQAVNHKEDMQISLEKEISELQKIILARETDYLIQQREQVLTIQEYRDGLNQIRQIFFEDQKKQNENIHSVNQLILDLKGLSQNKISQYEQQIQILTQQLQNKELDNTKMQTLYEDKEKLNFQEIYKLNNEIKKAKNLQIQIQELYQNINQLTDEIKQSNVQKVELQQENQKLNQIVNEYSNQIRCQQNHIQDLQNKLNKSQEQLNELEETKFLLSNMEKTLLELSSSYEVLQQKNNELEDKVLNKEQIERQFDSSKEIINNLENQLLNIQFQLQQLNSDYSKIYKENQNYQEKLQEYELQVKQYEETKQMCQNLESTLEELTNQFEVNQKQLCESQLLNQQVQEKLQIYTNEFSEKEDFLKQTICSLQDHIFELKQKLDEPKIEQFDLQQQSEQYAKLKLEFDKQFEQLNQEIIQKTNLIDILNSELKQITQDYQLKEQETVLIQSQIAKLQEIQDANEQLIKDYQSLDDKNLKLTINVKELTDQLVENQQIMIEKDLQIKNLITNLEETYAKINLESLQKQNSKNEIIQKYQQLEDELALKKKELENIQLKLLEQEEQIQMLQMTNDQLRENVNEGRENTDIQSYVQMIEELNQLVQELQEKLQNQELNSPQLELQTLKNLYQQKIKLVEKNTLELEEKQRLIENLQSEVEDKQILENTIEELFKEKTRYLKQLDQLSQQVSKDDNILKIKELQQKTKDLEEERNILKQNMESMIEDLHQQLSQLMKDKETLEVQMFQVKAQKEDFEQQLQSIEQQKQKELELKKQVPVQNNRFLNKVASIFVTESEMRKIQQQQ